MKTDEIIEKINKKYIHKCSCSNKTIVECIHIKDLKEALAMKEENQSQEIRSPKPNAKDNSNEPDSLKSQERLSEKVNAIRDFWIKEKDRWQVKCGELQNDYNEMEVLSLRQKKQLAEKDAEYLAFLKNIESKIKHGDDRVLKMIENEISCRKGEGKI